MRKAIFERPGLDGFFEFVLFPQAVAEDRIDQSSLVFAGKGDGLVDRRMLCNLAEENLVEPDTEQVTRVGLHAAASKLVDNSI